MNTPTNTPVLPILRRAVEVLSADDCEPDALPEVQMPTVDSAPELDGLEKRSRAKPRKPLRGLGGPPSRPTPVSQEQMRARHLDLRRFREGQRASRRQSTSAGRYLGPYDPRRYLAPWIHQRGLRSTTRRCHCDRYVLFSLGGSGNSNRQPNNHVSALFRRTDYYPASYHGTTAYIKRERKRRKC